MIAIKSIAQKDHRTLTIHWTDNRTQEFDVVELRRQCPCAVCVDEITNQRILKPEHVSENIRPIRIDSVGSYALNIKFNDHHSTGIYTFDLLQKIGSDLS